MTPQTAPAIDRRQPPAPGPSRGFRFPAFRRERLDNGLEVLVARLDRVPLVSIDLYTPAAGHFDPEGKAGLASLTAALLDEGTTRRSATELVAEVERLGGRLATSAGWNAASASVNLLSRDLELGAALLAEVTLEPSFPVAEFERLRRQRRAELLQQRNDPRAMAERAFARAVYGRGVYGTLLGGDDLSLDAISREDVVGFHADFCGLGAGTLVAVGDLDPEAFLDLARRAFGGAQGKEPPAGPSWQVAPRPGTRVVVVDRPGAAQTELRLGHASIRRTDPDHTRLSVLNSILGGKFTSRINLNLRERHGFTYGAYSQLGGRFGPGPFVVSTAVANSVVGAAVRELLFELHRLREEPVLERELADTRTYLSGVFVAQLQTIDQIALRLGTLGIYAFPDDYFETYLAEIAGLERQELLGLAQRHLLVEELAIVAVGPAAELVPQLAGFGELVVWDSALEPASPGAG